MDFSTFDSTYVERLAAGDPAVVEHFSQYFGELISIKLRRRGLHAHLIDDIRQETFLRVLQALRRGSIQQPERLGPYVNSVCNNVTMEVGRSGARISFFDDAPEASDHAIDSERRLIDDERRAGVRRVLQQMPPKNQKLLREIFIEERPPDEVCDELGIDRRYLRVLLFRARTQLREAVRRAGGR